MFEWCSFHGLIFSVYLCSKKKWLGGLGNSESYATLRILVHMLEFVEKNEFPQGMSWL